MKMTKIALLVLVAFAAVTYAVPLGTTVYPATERTASFQPIDIRAVTIVDYTGDTAKDSLGAGKYNVYGPFPLAFTEKSVGTKYLKFCYPSGTFNASTDSLQVRYQLLPSGNIKDTGTTWTILDTGWNGRGMGTNLDLSTTTYGTAIVFKMYAVAKARVIKDIRAIFRSNATGFRSIPDRE